MILSRLRAVPAFVIPTLGLLFIGLSASVHSSPEPPSPESADSAAPSRRMSRGEYLAREALTFRGAPYRFGGTSARGMDCSGLTMTVYRRWGMLLPRTSVAQWKQGMRVPKEQMRPGDLVFFKNTYKRGISHVGIYIGEGKFVHAANRRKGVIVSSLDEAYHRNHWMGARRVALEKLPEPPADTEPAVKPAE